LQTERTFFVPLVHSHRERNKRASTIFNARESVVDGKKDKASEVLGWIEIVHALHSGNWVG